MGLPNFFIIGAPKCGTTTLYEWLGKHPQVHAPHKEPGFFSQDLEATAHLPTHIPTLQAYEAIFQTCDPKVLISGEATPKYLYSNHALQTIALLRPDAKIIICLRNPVDLVISFHNQKFREGVENEKDFMKAWRRAFDTSGQIKSEAATIDGKINYYFWGAFGRHIQRVFDIFPQEQIIILTLEEIQLHPETTYARMLEFLRVDHDGRKEFPASNIGYKIKRPALHRAVRRLKKFSAPALRHLHELRGGQGLGVLKLLNRYNTEAGSYSRDIAQEVRVELQQVFADDLDLAVGFLQGRVLVNRDEIDHT